ncbi:hypothetical protein ABZ412_24820 [Nocardia sp. NPDC005746]|uniref:hypothetical protein n=1 Tax=Nocardia sp. NPDC005746 TaxID=3157062 RepID=UPI0033E5F134
MTDLDTILNAPTPVAARALEQASKGDRWWMFEHQQCDMFAQNHSWVESREHLTDPRIRLRVAHARVLRYESISAASLVKEQPRDTTLDEAGFWSVPLELQPWEARWWNAEDLREYYEGGSAGWTGATNRFPPRQFKFPILLPTGQFRGRIRQLEEVGAFALSNWLERVTVVHGTAEQAAAHRFEVAGCGDLEDGVPAAVVDFASAYPALVGILRGEQAYCATVSEALGRLKLWRLLSVLAGSPLASDITSFVDRVRCVTWHDPCDESLYLHLAIEDPVQGISWALDGQDFD